MRNSNQPFSPRRTSALRVESPEPRSIRQTSGRSTSGTGRDQSRSGRSNSQQRIPMNVLNAALFPPSIMTGTSATGGIENLSEGVGVASRSSSRRENDDDNQNHHFMGRAVSPSSSSVVGQAEGGEITADRFDALDDLRLHHTELRELRSQFFTANKSGRGSSSSANDFLFQLTEIEIDVMDVLRRAEAEEEHHSKEAAAHENQNSMEKVLGFYEMVLKSEIERTRLEILDSKLHKVSLRARRPLSVAPGGLTANPIDHQGVSDPPSSSASNTQGGSSSPMILPRGVAWKGVGVGDAPTKDEEASDHSSVPIKGTTTTPASLLLEENYRLKKECNELKKQHERSLDVVTETLRKRHQKQIEKLSRKQHHQKVEIEVGAGVGDPLDEEVEEEVMLGASSTNEEDRKNLALEAEVVMLRLQNKRLLFSVTALPFSLFAIALILLIIFKTVLGSMMTLSIAVVLPILQKRVLDVTYSKDDSSTTTTDEWGGIVIQGGFESLRQDVEIVYRRLRFAFLNEPLSVDYYSRRSGTTTEYGIYDSERVDDKLAAQLSDGDEDESLFSAV